jgi:virginiamycin B lyase
MEIKVNISTVRVSSPPSPLNVNIDMLASGTFTPTGDLGNSTGSSSEQSFSLEPMHTKEVSFIFTPTTDLWAGKYASMLGEQNGAITVMKAVKVHIVV